MRLDHLRVAAVNIDGVLLNDTFSPVIHDFVVSRGGAYTQAVEQSVFSQNPRTAARALARAAGVAMEPDEVLETYFAAREKYLADHPVRQLPGGRELLVWLRALGLETVCYGGLGRDHFLRHLDDCVDLFSAGYVCTADFRPGLREITTDTFGLRFDQMLFIDDVAEVAAEAGRLGTAFIGHPSDFAHGFQRRLMAASGVRHLVDRLEDIDEALLHRIDAESAALVRG
ncbi:HAD family phosphatase [Streptomyces sp. NPDC006365]|uniref:HAD family phosphatase n=1 Tax=Streptomyces sp. NPDC006365 TaxID=3364744 RepID=UPI0036CA8638